MFVFFFFFFFHYSCFDIGSRESKSIQANAVGGPTNHPSAPSITLSLSPSSLNSLSSRSSSSLSANPPHSSTTSSLLHCSSSSLSLPPLLAVIIPPLSLLFFFTAIPPTFFFIDLIPFRLYFIYNLSLNRPHRPGHALTKPPHLVPPVSLPLRVGQSDGPCGRTSCRTLLHHLRVASRILNRLADSVG